MQRAHLTLWSRVGKLMEKRRKISALCLLMIVVTSTGYPTGSSEHLASSVNLRTMSTDRVVPKHRQVRAYAKATQWIG